MISGDLLGLASVYLYVVLLFLFTEKAPIKSRFVSRKILHIGVGNIIFLLPLFETRWVMTFLAAAPFILVTFLFSPYSPLKIDSRTSSDGHGFGLVYYAISWTLLAFLFFDNPIIIAVGIAAMSYGDGFASLIGKKYGDHRFTLVGDEKTLKGSSSMFIFTLVMIFVSFWYYGVGPANHILEILLVAGAATMAEIVTPNGLDNLTSSLTAAILYYLLVFL